MQKMHFEKISELEGKTGSILWIKKYQWGLFYFVAVVYLREVDSACFLGLCFSNKGDRDFQKYTICDENILQ